ncbi:MAG: hypothetical protein ACOVQ5_08065 [Flavobacteriales bacterium]|jgi:hypothetical protein
MKIESFFLYCLVALIIVLSGCTVSGKYYSKYDSKKHDSEKYGSRMFNSIELSKDGSYIISEWLFIYHDRRHYKYEKSEDWIQQGDTITIDDRKYLHNHTSLVDVENGVVWKKRLFRFAKNE